MIRRNYVYNLVLSVFNILFPVLSFPYVSRILGPGGIGKAQFIVTFAQYFALVAAIGIPYYGVREVAKIRESKEKLSKLFSELTVIYVVASFLVSVVYIGVVVSFEKFNADRDLYLVGIWIVLLGFSSIDWFYQGIEDFKSITIRSVFVKAVCLLLIFCFVKTRSDLFFYLVISVVSVLGNNFINMIAIHKKITFTLKDLRLRSHLGPLFFIFGANLSIAMYNMLDTIFLGLLSDDKAVGFYTAGIKIARVAVPIVVSTGLVLLPNLSKSFENKDEKYEGIIIESYNFVLFSSIPMAFGLSLFAPEIISTVSGNEFNPAIIPMQILSVLPLLIGFGNLFGVQVLVASGQEKQMLKSVMVGTLFSLFLNVILVPSYREVGASVTNVVTEVIVASLFYYFARKKYRITLPIKSLVHAFIASLPFIPIMIVMRMTFSNPFFVLIFGTVLCGLIYFIIQNSLFQNIYTVRINNVIRKTIFRNNMQ